MMRPIARSDISANEVSPFPFLQKYPPRNEFWSFLNFSFLNLPFIEFFFSPPSFQRMALELTKNNNSIQN